MLKKLILIIMIYNNPDDAWMKHLSKEDQAKYGCFQASAIFIGFLIAMVICALCSCSTTKYVPEYHTDTLRLTRNIRDSIYVHDSTYVREAGDTILIEKWHTRWRDRWNTDTIYQSKHDSIPVPYEVTKEVPADLTWWQQTRLYMANIMIGLLAIVVAFYAVMRRFRW